MKLDDHGLFNHDIDSSYEGRRIKVNSEKELFDYLGLIWREPHERDGFDAVRVKESNQIYRMEDDVSQDEIVSELKNHKWVD